MTELLTLYITTPKVKFYLPGYCSASLRRSRDL